LHSTNLSAQEKILLKEAFQVAGVVTRPGPLQLFGGQQLAGIVYRLQKPKRSFLLKTISGFSSP
jgi:hypothetical protein